MTGVSRHQPVSLWRMLMTRIALLLVIGLGTVTLAWPAEASTCDVDDSSDSDDDWDDDYDDDDDGDSTPACINTTDIVGRSECKSFGTWDASERPRLRIGMGSSVSVFGANDLSFQGQADHDHKVSYRLENSQPDIPSEAVAAAVDTWVTAPVNRHMYIGTVFSMGVVSLPETVPTVVNGLTVDTQGAMYLAFGGLAGVSVPLGPLTLRGEAMVGHRFVVLGVETRQDDCVDNSSVHAGQWMVRPQVAVEAWLTPRVSAGITASTDAFRERDVSGGMFLQLHTTAFDGTRSR